MKSALDLFVFLEGAWLLERYIHGMHGVGSVAGLAKFTKKEESLYYSEDLKLNWGGFSNKGYQNYIYSMKGSDLYKKFSTQEPFYKIEMHLNGATGHYENGTYRCDAKYTLQDSSFTLVYNVLEGGVEYDITTEFTKLPEDKDIVGDTSQGICD